MTSDDRTRLHWWPFLLAGVFVILVVFEGFDRFAEANFPFGAPDAFGWAKGFAASLAVLAIGFVRVWTENRLLRRIDRERAAAEDRFRKIVEQSIDPISVIAWPSGRFELVNQAWMDLFGSGSSQLRERTIRDLELWADPVDRDRLVERAEPPGRFRNLEVRFRGRDGRTIPALVSGAMIDDEERHGLVLVVHDIGERQATLRELEKARTAALEASKLKGDFVASMSHEIRTPLNGVVGMTALLGESELTPEQREYTEAIRSAADSLLEIVNDVLDFSKIEAGMLSIDLIPFDLLIAIESVTSLMAARAEQRNLNLILRFSPDTPRRVIGDPGRVRQILTNLVGNAIKFTERGHVLVDVRPDRRDGQRVVIRFSVEDTGIGIPRDLQGVIFDRFRQAENSTTRRFGGTGLGLAISKQLTELLGGEIAVRSHAGEGSTFWFTLPFQEDMQPELLPDPAPDLIAVRMLVVDDNPLNRLILEEQLGHEGIRTLSVENGTEAIKALRQAKAAGDPFGMVILDYWMPDLNGEMVGHAIKADPAISNVVLVLFTSAGRRGDAERMLDAGFSAYLTKPLQPSVLMDALATAWASRKIRPRLLITRHALAERDAHRRMREAPVPAGAPRATVLLVEDNPLNQRVARYFLEKLGCRVEAARDGKEALTRIQRNPYDIVFMDCEMPVLSGYEATRQIRAAEPPERRVPIIAMTAHALPGDREHCLAAGMDDYLSKPIRKDTLAGVLQRWCPASRDAGSDEPPAATDAAALDMLAEDAGADFTRDLVQSFLRRLPARLEALRYAVEVADVHEVSHLAHELYNSTASLGATGMAGISRELEHDADRNGLGRGLELIERLEATRAGTTQGLRSWLEAVPTGP